MKVVEVMNKDVVTCHPLEKLSVIINKLELFHISGMPVVEKGVLVGVISQTDILKAVKSGSLQDMTVKDMMTTDIVSVSSAEAASVVAKIMIEKRINRVPVVDNDRLVGIVTRGDLIKAAAGCE
ncbi:MAG: inosine 5'-monophosphate dehydrogenase [Syntrophorhabdaceae bacterium PtaU1.Bin034]|jgi:CBS domain-containing protein|nr:MAG: inosine 5'-monophosphate dehydrogenase [Syntrophorhabdaceae bacterium PtaU1.Bin034]